MRTVRIYDNQSIKINTPIELGENGFGHVYRVLRMTEGDEISIFNGNGFEYQAIITECSKKKVVVTPTKEINKRPIESPLNIHLGQVISRGEKMDFTVQKAVELGVSEITPLISTRCGVRLKEERLDKKQDTLQKIVISACEQCGRVIVPKVNHITDINDFLATKTNDLKLTLNPYCSKKIAELSNVKNIRLLVGPEGGFTDDEINLATTCGYNNISLGPRILRTETAALVAISILQACFGDL
ncbi:MAG: 16S rRNA (uracil(1498)-N(3))-methyltransferase [Succinivibrionaceae bacterium]